jgi:enamine deaminase RidA (YjgF/YER057c/UK114 family)
MLRFRRAAPRRLRIAPDLADDAASEAATPPCDSAAALVPGVARRYATFMASDVRITVSEAGGRRRASSGAPWEPVVGYCRAIRTGDVITVSGTVGLDADGTYPATAGEQTRRALVVVRAAIEALGGRIEHVVRTRMYVTDIRRSDEIGRAHGEIFGAIRPATSMVQVARLIDDAALVEVEADAIVG